MDGRTRTALEIAERAGALALDFYRHRDALEVDTKGRQDFVTEADRAVETAIRAALADAFPDDAVVGEEHAPRAGTSGFTWVIDPIDGTANFVQGLPAWCVAIAGVSGARIEVAAIHDPVHGESFAATRGRGATLNGAPLRVRAGARITAGTIVVGRSARVPLPRALALIEGIGRAGGVWARAGSGALSLAWVAAGRYLGYAEAHMHAWDCLAGQLLVAEAGGVIEDQDAAAMIAAGGRVIAAARGVWDDLYSIADAAFSA